MGMTLDRIHTNQLELSGVLPTEDPSLKKGPYSKEWLDAFWMPYSGNRDFKLKPRMLVSAKG